MSLAGLKKQFNKANQYMSEKIGGAEKTKLDEEFMEMERKVDVTCHAVDELLAKTTEYLQPNPVVRAKMATSNTVSKVRGQQRNTRYPQPEGNLGEVLLKFGKDLGEDSYFGIGMVDTGESMKQLSDIKDNLDFTVKQNFLDPLQHLRDKDLKEANHHRKKLEGRRLDYDCKKRKQTKGGSQVPEEEIRMAEVKFDESKELAESGMRNILDSDVEQVRQLLALAEAQSEFHKQSIEVLERLTETLEDRIREAESAPRPQRSVMKKISNPYDNNVSDDADNGEDNTMMGEATYQPAGQDTKVVKALYDFEPENEGELGFSEGDMITLTAEIDDNWLEGTVHGQSGFFPRNYVEL
ncbi:endophilin-A1-like isoform X1 [Amphiura filiformis]|uniref:endophilin-A1-like isoform X1 n=1 Tax=Amphiura filiformis TaxID=82378 RepID=UPI003B218BEA